MVALQSSTRLVLQSNTGVIAPAPVHFITMPGLPLAVLVLELFFR